MSEVEFYTFYNLERQKKHRIAFCYHNFLQVLLTMMKSGWEGKGKQSFLLCFPAMRPSPLGYKCCYLVQLQESTTVKTRRCEEPFFHRSSGASEIREFAWKSPAAKVENNSTIMNEPQNALITISQDALIRQTIALLKKAFNIKGTVSRSCACTKL